MSIVTKSIGAVLMLFAIVVAVYYTAWLLPDFIPECLHKYFPCKCFAWAPVPLAILGVAFVFFYVWNAKRKKAKAQKEKSD
ncbi:hypothetical protein PCE1_002700 [Barthelona sp. PCE]